MNNSSYSMTVNRGNWSGKDMEVTVDPQNAAFTIAHYGDYDFRLQPRSEVDGCRVFFILIDGQPTDLTVSMYDGDDVWVASSGDIVREDSDRFVAAALLIANVL